MREASTPAVRCPPGPASEHRRPGPWPAGYLKKLSVCIFHLEIAGIIAGGNDIRLGHDALAPDLLERLIHARMPKKSPRLLDDLVERHGLPFLNRQASLGNVNMIS